MMRISTARRLACLCALLTLAGCTVLAPAPQEIRINQLQFIGSHNSYKQAMSAEHMAALQARNPAAAAALDYAHPPLEQQLDLGLRVLEIDVFFDPQAAELPVGHVQVIDMNTHCSPLRHCLALVKAWSDAHPRHEPILVMFNAKDQKLDGLPDPEPFSPAAFELMDRVVTESLGDRLITPADVLQVGAPPAWPTLASARGKVLLLLDEGGQKRDWYTVRGGRPLFANVPPGHPLAAIQVINDPKSAGALIRERVQAGYLVRTRADADTVEARSGDLSRYKAAVASGAQAISTDYYLPETPFGVPYRVWYEEVVRCNPVLLPDCSLKRAAE